MYQLSLGNWKDFVHWTKAESPHLRRPHLFHTAHTKTYKHISRLTVPSVLFILDLTENIGHRVMLHKDKYQVMLHQVWYIPYEDAPISQSSITICFLHRWHLDP